MEEKIPRKFSSGSNDFEQIAGLRGQSLASGEHPSSRNDFHSPIFPPLCPNPIRPGHNLPLPLTSFVGRKREIAYIQRLLSPLPSGAVQEGKASGVMVRLLTLTGPGGCGKSRLAIEASASLIKKFSDGVWWTELASFSDPALVPQAVAFSIGLQEQAGSSLVETLLEALQVRQLLLVLDNCEHLLVACGCLAATLMQACPRLSILTTSRAALHVTGETAWSVPSLAVPDPQHLFPSETDQIFHLDRYESVRLFIERAAAVLPGFTLTDQNFVSIAQICHRLDGIPLSIELAAARVKVLTTKQIASRLDHLFHLLARGDETALPRHHTLQATVDWSYNLLPEKAKLLLRRLSVFAGSFSLTAAEAICAGYGLDEEEVLDRLADLVDQSLVWVSEREPHEEARYRLLEMIRQYSHEKLKAAGESERVRERHLAFFLLLAEEAEPKLRGDKQVDWLSRLDAEQDNFREALNWSITAQSARTGILHQTANAGLRLVGALWPFWQVRSSFSEGHGWLKRAMAISEDAPAWARAKALSGLGTIAHDQGDYQQSMNYHQKALELYQEVGDIPGKAFTINCIGCQFLRQGEFGRAVSFFNKAKDLYQELGDPWGMALEPIRKV